MTFWLGMTLFSMSHIFQKLPFRVAEHGMERFEAIHSDYSPYVHQNRAYERLVGEDPQSTLVATGTGSGKTECFLYPILEYCYQHRQGFDHLSDECAGIGPGYCAELFLQMRCS